MRDEDNVYGLQPGMSVQDRLFDLSSRIQSNVPNHRNPHKFHEEKSELALIARFLAGQLNACRYPYEITDLGPDGFGVAVNKGKDRPLYVGFFDTLREATACAEKEADPAYDRLTFIGNCLNRR